MHATHPHNAIVQHEFLQEEVVLGDIWLVLRHLLGPELQLVPHQVLRPPLGRGAPLQRGRHRGGAEELGVPRPGGGGHAPFAGGVDPQQGGGGLGVGMGLLGRQPPFRSFALRGGLGDSL